jgi:hypothetical protein
MQRPRMMTAETTGHIFSLGRQAQDVEKTLLEVGDDCKLQSRETSRSDRPDASQLSAL